MLFLYDCYRENQIARANVVNHIQTLDNLTKAGVYAIEVLGILAVVLMFCALALWELRLPREERWYRKINLRKKHERIIH